MARERQRFLLPLKSDYAIYQRITNDVVLEKVKNELECFILILMCKYLKDQFKQKMKTSVYYRYYYTRQSNYHCL